MKTFAVFMTILMFLTTFELCSDEAVEVSKSKREIFAAPNDSQDEKLPCTPFCNCARCPFSVLLPTTIGETGLTSIIIKKFLAPLFGTPVEITGSVWQPPKSA